MISLSCHCEESAKGGRRSNLYKIILLLTLSFFSPFAPQLAYHGRASGDCAPFGRLLFTSSLSYAEEPASLKVRYATGERSQTDEIEERDLSDDYSFHKYGATVKAESQQGISYGAGAQRYEKDFDTARDSLDNKTNIYNGYLSCPVHKKDDLELKLNADYRLRTKRYSNSPSLEYDQNNITGGIDMGLNKNYSLELAGGVQDYEYINDPAYDLSKTFFKIAPAIENDTVAVSGCYKRNLIDQSAGKKDYSEDSVSAKTSVKLNMAFINKLSGHYECGKNDTRDSDEDREDALRFEYELWDIASQHKLKEGLDTQFTYGQKYREYLTSINSYENWFMKNKTELNLFEKESFKVDLLLGGEHKETKFCVNEALSYNKNSISGGFNMLEREKWSLKPEFQFTKYIYPPKSTSNQNSYKLSLDFKKYLGATDAAIEVGYWYAWKDYRYKADIEQWSLNLSYEIKF